MSLLRCRCEPQLVHHGPAGDNENDNDNDTLRKVQHPSMKAWPYKQECRNHDSAKKESVSLPLLRTVCSASNLEMNSKQGKRHVTTHRHEFTNSELRIHGFGATQRNRRGSQEGDKQARETRKKQTPGEEVGRYHSSSVTPDSQPNFLSVVRGTRTQ